MVGERDRKALVLRHEPGPRVGHDLLNQSKNRRGPRHQGAGYLRLRSRRRSHGSPV
jgi:hypothetical protein